MHEGGKTSGTFEILDHREHFQKKYIRGGKVTLTASLRNSDDVHADLWYSFDREFDDAICDDRCDGFVTTLLVAAMRFGYESIRCSYPISRKLYYNLTYHVIPQLCHAGSSVPQIRIDAPLTDTVFHGDLVCTGMSRGIDSFATMYEYGSDFELAEYRINAVTYFQAGAHHGRDPVLGRGAESTQELYVHQMERTREFCKKYGYPLIVVDSNIASILHSKGLFKERSFDRTHTFRNLAIAMLLQKRISRYYYSSTYQLNEFKLSLNCDMAHYERWLIPLLWTGSIEFYQSNQDWSRMDKVEKISDFEPSYDYLQVCLTQSGNCGICMKCRRTLMELDALGDDVLDRFSNSFDVERYRKENRAKWFGSIMTDKESSTGEAHYYDEAFVCASEHHPELLSHITPEKHLFTRTVRLLNNGVGIRSLPSTRSAVLFTAKKGDRFSYLGEYPNWVCIKTADGKIGYVFKKYVTLR